MSGARNHRGRSVQDVGTPRDLLDAVEVRFGKIGHDLAASAENAVCERYITAEQNALIRPWPAHGVMWLNPPFANIAPWVQRCRQWVAGGVSGQPDSLALVLVLIPASVDANYWRDHVAGFARVLALNPRVTFIGHAQPFPKSLALCVYDPRFPQQPNIVEPWRWK